MHFVYFKFRSTIEYEKLAIDSRVITVGEFKRLIAEHKAIGKNADTRIEVKNATTDQNYTDDSELIYENSTLVLRRVPSYMNTISFPSLKLSQANEKIGPNQNQSSMVNNGAFSTEEEKMKVIMNQNQSVIDFEQNQSDMLKTTKRTGKVPVCYHCKAIGHVYRACPLLTQQSQVMRDEPTHIFLKSQLGLLPSQGSTNPITSKHDASASSTVGVGGGLNNAHLKNIPDYLICPLCHDLMEKAVLAPCCGTSFCDSCIQDYLLKNEYKCFSCESLCYPDTIVANISLRKSIFTFTGVDGGATTTIKQENHSAPVLLQSQPSSNQCNVDSKVNSDPPQSLQPQPSTSNDLASNTNSSSNLEGPVMKSLATHMLNSLLTPLLTNLIPKNGTKKQWYNNQQRNNQRFDEFCNIDKAETLKRRTELFNKLEMLCSTQKVLSKEQFTAMKGYALPRKYVFRGVLQKSISSDNLLTDNLPNSRLNLLDKKSESNSFNKSKRHHYHDERSSRSNSQSIKHEHSLKPSTHAKDLASSYRRSSRRDYSRHKKYSRSRSNDRKRKHIYNSSRSRHKERYNGC